MVHDGGSSVVAIAFCPSCGSKLPQVDEADELLTEDEGYEWARIGMGSDRPLDDRIGCF
jgi:hypothetical protein